jgi:hypothetical protein
MLSKELESVLCKDYRRSQTLLLQRDYVSDNNYE